MIHILIYFVLSTDNVALEARIKPHLRHDTKPCLRNTWCSVNVYSAKKNSNAFAFYPVAKTILNVNEELQNE